MCKPLGRVDFLIPGRGPWSSGSTSVSIRPCFDVAVNLPRGVCWFGEASSPRLSMKAHVADLLSRAGARVKRKLVAGLGLTTVSLLALEATARVRTPRLSRDVTGDPALIHRAGPILCRSNGPRDRVSIAVVEAGGVQKAHFGADDLTQYEVGSVTKTMTAALFADMVDRDDVDVRMLLGEIFDLGDSEIAGVSLEELATHTSGLPAMVNTARNLLGLALWPVLVHDPSASTTVGSLCTDAQRVALGPKEYTYSNLGYSLLGQALARCAGTDYSTLLQKRLFLPMGMANSFVPPNTAALPEDAPRGYSVMWGRRAEPWTLGAEAPSGGVRSTLSDMIRYVRAHLDGAAPGIRAMEPVREIGEGLGVGYGWHIEHGSMAWHNGMTGGFASWVSVDRERGRGIVVLSNTMNSVDELGRALAGCS